MPSSRYDAEVESDCQIASSKLIGMKVASAAPRATTAAQDMDILDASQASPFSTAKEIGADAGVSASVSIMKRPLAEGKLGSHVAAQRPRLSEANETLRLNFATEYVSWTVYLHVYLDNTLDQKQRVWRPVNVRNKTPFTCSKSHRAAALLSMLGAQWPNIDLAFFTVLKDR
ncbi:hypothetical protein HPB49_024642 [Dermacentor silvarum]|uniref:Uncharacterized protein n=1 Tax=Dermacentor silvarum TaxID=543639 RepID=A0ACB8DLE9_DERSI|nr:hypothetical protein HPB49_024642 [Dermacentor silvarum]